MTVYFVGSVVHYEQYAKTHGYTRGIRSSDKRMGIDIISVTDVQCLQGRIWKEGDTFYRCPCNLCQGQDWVEVMDYLEFMQVRTESGGFRFGRGIA